MKQNILKEETTRNSIPRKAKISIIISLVILCCILLTGCSGQQKSIIGTWKGMGGLYTVIFRDDCTYSSSPFGFCSYGCYTDTHQIQYDDQSFTLFFTGDYDPDQSIQVRYTYQLEDNGNTLTIFDETKMNYDHGQLVDTRKQDNLNLIFTRESKV